MTATRERAINLRDWEVRAIQAGRLKMLVRPVKWVGTEPGLNLGFSGLSAGFYCTDLPSSGFVLYSRGRGGCWEQRTRPTHCPYGKAGDRLRGREAAAINDTGRPAARYHFNAHVKYKADGLNINFDVDLKHWRTAFENNALRYQSSIHMPRWAVRNWLEITEVRCGRARDMSQHDAESAGADCDFVEVRDGGPEWSHDAVWADDYVSPFAAQYDADHGEGAWERDWVWMIGIKRIEGGK